MSCIRITTCQLARSPPAFPAKDFQLKKSLSAYLGTRLPKISLKSTQATSQAAIVCLFGDKGKSENENQYTYIIEGEEITVLTKDFLRFVFTQQKSIRLRRVMDQWSKFFQIEKEAGV